MQEYSKALMFSGLVHLARRDAVREGDGPGMIDFWKIDMPQFWGEGHYKYVIIAHSMLAGMLPPMWLNCNLKKKKDSRKVKYHGKNQIIIVAMLLWPFEFHIWRRGETRRCVLPCIRWW